MIAFVLQVSVHKPTRFRISVFDDFPHQHPPPLRDDTQYKSIGWFDTPEYLMATLVPYLKMEEGG